MLEAPYVSEFASERQGRDLGDAAEGLQETNRFPVPGRLGFDSLELSDYQRREKPEIDWHNAEARAEWLKTIVRDGRRLLEEIDGTPLVDAPVREAASLLSTILIQDISEGEDVEPEIRRGIEPDRLILTDDPEMRHGRESTSTLLDGYKVHVAEDLETELLTDVEVTPGNAHDSEPVEEMLTDSAERLGAMPTEIIGDSHYGSTDLRADLGQHATRHRGRRQAADPRERATASPRPTSTSTWRRRASRARPVTPRRRITDGAMKKAVKCGRTASRRQRAARVR